MADDSQLDVVQHPLLGPIKFPKDMPFDERNSLIDNEVRTRSSQPGAMQTRKGGPIVNATPEIPPSKVSLPQKKQGAFSSAVGQGKEFLGGIADIPRSIPQSGPDILSSWPERQVGESGDYRARAEEALKQGDLVGYLGHLINSAMAVTMIPQTVEGVSQTAETNPARAGGQITGMGLLEKAPDMVAGAPELARRGTQGYLRIGKNFVRSGAEEVGEQNVAAIAKNEQATAEATAGQKAKIQQAKIAEPQAFADAEAKQQQRAQTVQQANAESQAGYQQRQQHLDIADQHAQTIADRLPQVHQAAKAEARAAYGPDPKGSYEPAEIKAGIVDAAAAKLQGNTELPAAVKKVIADIDKPPAPTILDQATVFKGAGKAARAAGTLDDLSPKARAKFYEQNPTAERVQPDTPTSTGEPPALDAQRIHGFMSELGSAARSAALKPDEASAINATRSFLEQRLRKLYENESRLSDFTNGQAAWKKMANTFENASSPAKGGSPIAQALQTKDPVTGKLRPDYVQAALSGEKSFPIAQEMLDRYRHLGAPTNELEVMKTNGDFADKLPSKVKWQDAPGGPKYPNFTEWGKLPETPEAPTMREFDPVEARKAALKQISEGMGSMKGIRGPLDILALLRFMKGDPAALGYPILRRAMSDATSGPKVVDWLSRATPEEMQMAKDIPARKVALKRTQRGP